jgi:hypothetical protein
MAIRMLCPNGHELVTEDQHAGRKIRCPHCQLILIVPSPQIAITSQPAPPRSQPQEDPEEIDLGQYEEDVPALEAIEEGPPRPRQRPAREYGDDYEEEEDRPRRKKKKKGSMSRHQLSMTSLGLGFHYAKLLTYLIAMNVTFACNILMARAAVGGEGGSFALLRAVSMAAAVVFNWVGPTLGITGSILCCWVPAKTGGKPMIITSLALDVVAFVLPIISLISAGASVALGGFAAAASAFALVLVLLAIAAACTLTSFVLFILFLRQLAFFLDDSGMADEAMGIVIHYILLLITPLVTVTLLLMLVFFISRDFASSLFANCIFLLVMAVAIIAWLVFVIKLMFRILNLIGSLRYTLRARYNV